MENVDAVRILVGRDQPLPRGVELEVPGRGAAGVLHARYGKKPRRRHLVVHAEDRDAVVASVRDKDELARTVHSDPPASVHAARKGVGNGSDRLHEAQRRNVFPAALPSDELCGRLVVELKHRNLGRELVDNVTDWKPRMELDVAGTERPPPGRTRWLHTGSDEGPQVRVVAELPDEVHSEVGHVGDAAEERVQDNRVGVRVALPLLLRRGVVQGMVHVLIVLRHHLAALVGIEHRARPDDLAAVLVHLENADGGVPIIHDKHVLALLVHGYVAR
mmetsp:Transcript_88135/g.247910  ORF Transcript_88135/g.247910 Transcript_88135/m.247910 type:complete len:275 (-) Transcript_88135:445-1269(-)